MIILVDRASRSSRPTKRDIAFWWVTIHTCVGSAPVPRGSNNDGQWVLCICLMVNRVGSKQDSVGSVTDIFQGVGPNPVIVADS